MESPPPSAPTPVPDSGAPSAPPRRGLASVLAVLSVSAFLGLTAYLFSRMDLAAFFSIWRRIPTFSLLLPLGIYLGLNLLRAVRFRIMIAQPVPLGLLVPVTLYYNFLAQTFPFRSGELSYIVLLRRHRPGLTSQGASSLVGSKLFEMLMVVAGGLVGVMSLSGRLREHFALVCGALAIGFLASLWAIYRSGTVTTVLTRLVAWVCRNSFLQTWPFARRLTDRMGRVAAQLDDMRQPRRFSAMVFVSMGTYLASVVFNLVLLRLAGVEVGFVPLLAVISFVMAAGVLPLSIAGLGVIEGSWAFGLAVLLGVAKGEAIAIGFFLHGSQLFAACLAGILGYLWQRTHTRKEAA